MATHMATGKGADVGTALSAFTARTKYADIPDQVLEFVKCLTLKTVAGMVAGADKPAGRKMASFTKARRLPEDASVIGHGFRTSLWESVLANAFFAHASELEDDSFPDEGGCAWDITVIPLLFPLAEKLKLSGRSLLEAIVAGLEVHARVTRFKFVQWGLAVVPGSVGPAAGAARALGLTAQEAGHAMGLAVSGPGIAFPSYGTDAHYLEAALMSLQGIIAAELAKEGLTGNADVSIYLTNFLGTDKRIPETIVAGLGEDWKVRELQIKKYPCCFLTHPSIDLLLQLRREHNLTYDKVESIELHAHVHQQICDRPNPQNDHDLQFSLYHVLSCAMMDGDVNLSHITEQACHDPRRVEARSRVKVVFHSDWPEDVRSKHSAELLIRTKDGRQISGRRAYSIGSPEEPLSVDGFVQLYRKFTVGLLKEEEISKTTDMVLNLEKLNDITELMGVLARKR